MNACIFTEQNYNYVFYLPMKNDYIHIDEI